MIKITVAAMGKLKEKYFVAAADEYKKRLSRYCDLNVCEITPVLLPEDPAEPQINAALLKEAEKIKKACEGKKIIALCVEGEPLSSEAFAEIIDSANNSGTPLAFVVGSSYGLHDSIKAAAYKKISFSKMTFPHKLFRVMLLEQIYRAFKIKEGGKYHK